MFELGSSLRDARERKRLTFADLEQATKVRAKYLRYLEDDDFAALPGPTYVKGFLRVYAEALGLDGQLYVDEYASRFLQGDDEVVIRPRRTPPPRKVRWIERHAVTVALAGILVVAAVVLGAWKFGPSRSGSPTVQAPSPSTKVASGATAAVKTRTAGAARVSTAVLVLRAKANTWVEVHDTSAAGRLLFQGTIEQGQAQRFRATRLWLNVGAPAKLAATVNGRTVLLPGGTTPRVLVATANGVAPVIRG